MKIENILSPEQVVHDLRVAGKSALLEDLARRAGEVLGLEESTILSALLQREALGSTGVGDGVAIPHARLNRLVRPFGLLARLRGAIDFEAVDDRPVDLVFLLLLPASPHGEQLNALACVARRLRDPEAAQAMRSARDASGLYASIRGSTALG